MSLSRSAAAPAQKHFCASSLLYFTHDAPQHDDTEDLPALTLHREASVKGCMLGIAGSHSMKTLMKEFS